MRFLDLIRTAWRSLLLHKLRSSLSALGIMLGVVAVVAMLAIAEGAKRETLEQLDRLGTNNIIVRSAPRDEQARERLSSGLTLADARLLERGIPGLIRVAPLKEVRAQALLQTEDNALRVLAVTRAYQQAKGLAVKLGRFLCDSDVARGALVCALGAESARALGQKGRPGAVLRLGDREYKVVGTLRPRGWKRAKSPALAARDYDRAIFIPLGAEPSAGAGGADPETLSEVSLQVADSRDVPACAAAARSILARTRGGVMGFQVVAPRELLRQAQRTRRLFNIVLGGVAVISLLVGGIGVMNIMLANVSERTREIGVRRAIGASRAHIVAHFLCESALLTLIGGCVGVAAGAGVASLVSALAGWRTALTVWSVLVSVAMAAVAGLVSGAYPAARAANMDPVEALRRE